MNINEAELVKRKEREAEWLVDEVKGIVGDVSPSKLENTVCALKNFESLQMILRTRIQRRAREFRFQAISEGVESIISSGRTLTPQVVEAQGAKIAVDLRFESFNQIYLKFTRLDFIEGASVVLEDACEVLGGLVFELGENELYAVESSPAVRIDGTCQLRDLNHFPEREAVLDRLGISYNPHKGEFYLR